MRGGGLSRLASLSALRRFDNRDRSSPALFLNLKRQNRRIKLLFFMRMDQSHDQGGFHKLHQGGIHVVHEVYKLERDNRS